MTEWKLVPVEPTNEQLVAVSWSLSDRILEAIYKAAVAAAPSPWIKTADKWPLDSTDPLDAYVVACTRLGKREVVMLRIIVTTSPDTYPYWRPIPKAELPEDV